MSDTMVTIAPIVEALAPYVIPVVVTLVGAAVSWAAQAAKKYAHVSIDAQLVDNIREAAKTEAGAILAKDARNLQGVSFHMDHPAILEAADNVAEVAAKEISALGMTPDRVNQIVLGEVGKLQAVASPYTVAAPASSGIAGYGAGGGQAGGR